MFSPHRPNGSISTSTHLVCRLHLLVLFALLFAAVMPALAAVQPDDKAKAPKPKKILRGEEKKYEITETEHGKQLAKEAAVRWEKEQGVKANPADLQVYEFGTGDDSDTLIMPADLRFESAATIVHEDGSVETTVEVTGAEQPKPSGGKLFAPLANPPIARSYCWSRKTNSTGYMDACYTLWKLSDIDSSRDYFEMHHRNEATSTGIYELTSVTISGARSSTSPAMSWVDWKPGAAETKSCTSVDLGIAYKAVSVSIPTMWCERWVPTKYAEAGKYANRWEDPYALPIRYQTTRRVGYTTLVSVPQGTSPWWTYSHSFWAQP